MSSKEFIEKSAAAAAATTGHMILDNMLERTIGKKLSMLTIPTFLIALSVYSGYLLSDLIDPEKGKDRFSYAIMNPIEAAQMTGFNLVAIAAQENVQPVYIQPIGSTGTHSSIVNSDYYGFGERVLFESIREFFL